MENASKALIIAGAILISILLISVGIKIINSTGNVTNQVGSVADAMAIQTFNAQFEQYEGTAVSASNVKSLINKVNANNINSSNKVKLTGQKFKINTTQYKTIETSGIINSHKYTVNIIKHASQSCECGHSYTATGYICLIKIKDNNYSRKFRGDFFNYIVIILS